MTALAPSQAKKSFNRTLLLCPTALGAHSTSAAVQRDNTYTTTTTHVPPPSRHRHSRPPSPRVCSITLSFLLNHTPETKLQGKNLPSIPQKHSLPPPTPTTSPTTKRRHVEENLLRRHQWRCSKGRASFLYVPPTGIPLSSEDRTEALTFPPRPQHMTSRRTSSPPRQATSP